MRILIIGSDANAYALAKYMSELKKVDLVFVAPGNKYICDFATSVDIPASDVDELVDFAKAYEITLTVVVSEVAVNNSISTLFAKNGLHIFAPTLDAARVSISKSSAKKTLYKLRVQTPKFGIFDRENVAVDYARKSKYPLVVKTDTHSDSEKPVFCSSFKKAKRAIELFFESFNKKIIVEDYVDAKLVSFYVLTDGFSAFPIGRVCKRTFDNDSLISYSPDYYISDEVESKIMSKVVYPIIDEIAKHSSPYVGVLGIDLLLRRDNFSVLEFNPFYTGVDLQCMLPLLENDFAELCLAATYGSLSDEYTYLSFSDKVSISMKIATYIKDVDFGDCKVTYDFDGSTIVTSLASTLTKAVERLINVMDYIEDYEYDKTSLLSILESRL